MVRNFSLRLATLGSILLGAHFAAAQSDPSNFNTIIDLPPDVLPSSLGSDTQVNVLQGGAIGGNYDVGAANGSLSNIEINVLGGSIGSFFDVYNGATVNLVEGTIENALHLYDGGQFNVLGGELNGALLTYAGSTTTIADGRINQLIGRTGSIINIGGGYVGSGPSQIGIGLASDPPTVLNLTGGSLASSFDARANSVLNMSDGLIGSGFLSRLGSVVNLTGGRIYWYYDLQGELNMSGGSIGLGFSAIAGATLTANDGYFEYSAEIEDGAYAHFSGAQVNDSLFARSGSQVRLSGGVFGALHASESAASVTFAGGEFLLDGQPVAGLSGPGSQVSIVVPQGSLLSGTFADGTPFAFSTADQDNFGEVILEEAILPAIGPAVITASTDAVPLGIRSGQTLIVDDGAVVRRNFAAGPGSTVNVLPGGIVTAGMEAIGAQVNVTGGQIEYGFDAMQGSTVAISGGLTNDIDVFDGSSLTITGAGQVGGVRVKTGGHADILGGQAGWLRIDAGGSASMSGGRLIPFTQHMFGGGGVFNVSGGSFAGAFSGTGGGQVYLHGGDFKIDGQPVAVEPSAATPIELPQGSLLTGVLADGSPLAFSSLKGDRIGPASLTLVPTGLPDEVPGPIVVEHPSDLNGLREGQLLIIEDGGSVRDYFNALQGSSIQVRGNGSIGNALTLVSAELEVEAGSTGSLTLLAGSEATISGDGQTGDATLYASRLNVSEGGSVYYTYLRDGSHARIVGGEVSVEGRGFPIRVESGSSIEFSGRARTAGIEFQAGTSGVIAGGEIVNEVDLFAGAELQIIATEFWIDGVPIEDLDPGESLVWGERTGSLSGTFMNGQAFEFDLSQTTNSFRRDFFDPAAALLFTRILAGDFDRSGSVDAADYQQWLAEYGTEVTAIGIGADGNYDGVVNAADYTIWRNAMTAGPAGATAAPEAAGILWLFAVAAACVRRRC